MSRTHNERLLRARDEVDLSELTLTYPCARCFPDGEAPLEIRLVSPRGVIHECGDYEDTECGWDATGPGWWWAL